METSVGSFRVEAVQEIWRSEDTTFNIFYISKDTACIKGLRGIFSLQMKKEIQEYLLSRGVTTLCYERYGRNGVFKNKILKGVTNDR